MTRNLGSLLGFCLVFGLGCGSGQHGAANPPEAPEAAPDLAGPAHPGDPIHVVGDPVTDPPGNDPPGTDPPAGDGMLIADGGVAANPVSFSRQIVPMFDRRDCAACHSGNGPGRDLGNLTLDGGNKVIFREVVQEISPNFAKPRVDLQHPEESLILTLPGAAADVHPVTVFASSADADYQLLLTWITQGAKAN
jgi:hypothetical protein